MTSNNKITSLSVFLPCFNEEKNIKPLVRKLLEVLPNLTSAFEIIIINDGSTDHSQQVARELSNKDHRIKLVNHPNNQGYGSAIKSGINKSQYEWIFFTDGDMQFNVTELSSFIPYTSNYSAIIGYRKNRADGAVRAFNARLFKHFIDILYRLHVKDIDCAFKLFKADIIKPLPLISNGAMISTEILYRLKKQHVAFKQVPVTHHKRRYGEPTGNSLKVVMKAGLEAFQLYFLLKLTSQQRT
jgi:glycosyltransferase involved in cell wall biosynthesis